MNLLKIKETSINNTTNKLTFNSNNIIEVFENSDCDY